MGNAVHPQKIRTISRFAQHVPNAMPLLISGKPKINIFLFAGEK